MTFPQVLRMSDGVHDPGDPLMVTWVLAWVAHQLPNAPAHIFDANIFYPERNTLAYSETLLVPGMLAAPLHWLGVAPILVYNLVFLSGFALSGVGVALLVRRLTGNTGAAIVAGIVFAFPPYRIDHYAHLQLQQTQFIPLAMWAFHRLLDSGRLRDGVLLGVCTACQMLSCMYYGLFLIPYMAVVCGAMLIAARTLSKQRITALAVAAAIVIVAMIPVGRAYLAAREVVGERGRAEVAQNSATWRNYLAPPETNAMYGKVFARFMEPERRLFPGFVAVALAIVGLWPSGRGYLRTPQFAYVLGLILAFDVSLGFNGVIYRGLYDYFLPFKALRIPARMGLMVGFSLAVLAGYGATRIAKRLPSPALRRAVLTTIGILMLAEYASTPLVLWAAPRHPPESVRRSPARRRRRPDVGDLRVPDRRDGRSGVSLLLDVPLAVPGQRLQRVLPAVVPEDRQRRPRFSRRCVDGRGPIARRALPGDPRGVALRRALRAAGVRAGSSHRSPARLRHPWQREDKHAEISVYRVLINTDATSR